MSNHDLLSICYIPELFHLEAMTTIVVAKASNIQVMLPEHHCPEESPELLTVLADSEYGKSNVNMSLGNFEPENKEPIKD